MPHLAGLHAIQVLLAVAAILNVLATRRAWLRAERVRARLVGAAGFGYAGVFTILGWQAARGQSVLHPDAATLVAFGAVAVLTLAGVAQVVTAARRLAGAPVALSVRGAG